MDQRIVSAIAAAAMLFTGWAAAGVAERPRVGEVMFVIGTPRLMDALGNVSRVVRGTPVHVSDRLETSDGGHVMVRFVDGANISVRPNSRLAVEVYQYNPAAPAASTVKLQLEEGVARSITGKAGEAAKDRFRLNTPLAAIGVKGTDFIVAAEADHVRVAVQSGAVVVAPFSASCRAEGLGPCANDTARTLSDEMIGMVLEMRRTQKLAATVPEDVQVLQLRKAEQVANSTPTAKPALIPGEAPVVVSKGSAESPIQTQSSNTVLALLTSAPVLSPPVTGVPVAPAPTPLPPVVQQPVPEPVPVAPPAAPPPAPVAELPPLQPSTTPANLAWGRWSWAAVAPGSSIAVSYAEASAGRQSTVGNLAHALFRPPGAIPDVLPAQLGQVDFTLRAAEAHYTAGGKVEQVGVNRGILSIDFASARFSTALGLNHPATGAMTYQAQGVVRNDGFFAATQPDGRLAGALSLDGREAGYLFEKQMGNGQLSGMTLWSR